MNPVGIFFCIFSCPETTMSCAVFSTTPSWNNISGIPLSPVTGTTVVKSRVSISPWLLSPVKPRIGQLKSPNKSKSSVRIKGSYEFYKNSKMLGIKWVSDFYFVFCGSYSINVVCHRSAERRTMGNDLSYYLLSWRVPRNWYPSISSHMILCVNTLYTYL